MTISLKIKRIMLIALLLSAAVSVSADGYIDPGTTKWINVGSLQSNFAAGGVERAWNNVYYEGMR